MFKVGDKVKIVNPWPGISLPFYKGQVFVLRSNNSDYKLWDCQSGSVWGRFAERDFERFFQKVVKERNLPSWW